MDHRLHKAMVFGKKKHTGELNTDAGFVWGPSELQHPDRAPKQEASMVRWKTPQTEAVLLWQLDSVGKAAGRWKCTNREPQKTAPKSP